MAYNVDDYVRLVESGISYTSFDKFLKNKFSDSKKDCNTLGLKHCFPQEDLMDVLRLLCVSEDIKCKIKSKNLSFDVRQEFPYLVPDGAKPDRTHEMEKVGYNWGTKIIEQREIDKEYSYGSTVIEVMSNFIDKNKAEEYCNGMKKAWKEKQYEVPLIVLTFKSVFSE